MVGLLWWAVGDGAGVDGVHVVAVVVGEEGVVEEDVGVVADVSS